MNLLLLVHPDYAANKWSRRKHRARLGRYFEETLVTIEGFQGDVVATRDFITTDRNLSIHNVKQLVEFRASLKATKKVKVVEDWGNGWLLRPQLDLSQYDYVEVGGGYVEMCLLNTVQHLWRHNNKQVECSFNLQPDLCFSYFADEYEAPYFVSEFPPIGVLPATYS